MSSSVRSYIVCASFFLFKQKTAYEMRISDWSSDVCSSDLDRGGRRETAPDDLGEHEGLPRRTRYDQSAQADYRRSTRFDAAGRLSRPWRSDRAGGRPQALVRRRLRRGQPPAWRIGQRARESARADRKSTRLNSSH